MMGLGIGPEYSPNSKEERDNCTGHTYVVDGAAREHVGFPPLLLYRERQHPCRLSLVPNRADLLGLPVRIW
jgi:hypothetical protein